MLNAAVRLRLWANPRAIEKTALQVMWEVAGMAGAPAVSLEAEHSAKPPGYGCGPTAMEYGGIGLHNSLWMCGVA